MKQLDTLVADILTIFDPNTEHTPSEENLEYFADTLKEVLRTRFRKRDPNGPVLRFSGLGKQDRQIWYASRDESTGGAVEAEELTPQTYVKFLIGDILESVLLFLAKEAGHEVSNEQKEVEIEGVKGHIDAVIDGVVVDVKTASPFGFKKFKDGSLLDNDPFGYVRQLSGYANVLTPGKPAAFLAYDKVSGEICLSYLSATTIRNHPPAERIIELKKIIANPEPPPRCYASVPDGQSGNQKLDTGCSYCAYKDKCWSDANNGTGLRKFIYSTGPRFLTTVKKLPNVYEVIS